MYKIVASISVILRTFYFPNPFTKYFEVIFADDAVLSSFAVPAADLINMAFGATILWWICYPLVGIVYDRGEAPVIGSILYLIAVFINSKVLIWISNFADNLKVFGMLFVGAIIAECIILFLIRGVKEYLL